MNPVKINLLKTAGGPAPADRRRKRVRAVFAVFAYSLLFALAFGFGRLSLTETASAAFARLEEAPIFRLGQLIASQDRQMDGERDDRINILLLGIGGEGHDGPMLTDTIILASIRPSDSAVSLLSIPRDLLIPVEGYGWRKINSANAYGELKGKGQGAELARLSVENLLGMEIPYYVRLDFSGFREIIDDLGGITVEVERSFSDRSYPTDNYGYQTVSFTAGSQMMDGDAALKYSRSRHGNNGEGSDFARARRQQKVILAVKERALDLNLLREPAKVAALLSGLQANLRTNLQIGEILRLAKIGREVDSGDIAHRVLSDGPGAPLTSATVGGAYVLVPKNGDWEEVRSIARDLLKDARGTVASVPAGEEPAAAPAPARKDPTEIRLEILNGTLRSGLAGRTAERLRAAGYLIGNVGNAASQARTATAIYDLSGGLLTDSVRELAGRLGIANPETVASAADPAARRHDILIILGQDYTE